MRFLIVSDIHGREEVLRSLLSRDFDYLVILGDLTNRMREMHLFSMLPPETLFIPGNNEKPELGVHGKVVEISGIRFACIGGSLKTPFSTPFELEEEDYKKISAELSDFDFLLTHSPPHGVLDDVGGVHIGSKALRELVEKIKPKAVFTGHVHEYAGSISFIDRIPVINPGPKGIILEL